MKTFNLLTIPSVTFHTLRLLSITGSTLNRNPLPSDIDMWLTAIDIDKQAKACRIRPIQAQTIGRNDPRTADYSVNYAKVGSTVW